MTLSGHRYVISALQFSADSKCLASGSWDSCAALWSVEEEEGKRLVGLLRGHYAGIGRVVFAANAKTLLTGGHDWMMRWWSIATSQEMLRFQDVRWWCVWNPTDNLLIWQDKQGAIRVTDLPTLAEIDVTEAKEKAEARRP